MVCLGQKTALAGVHSVVNKRSFASPVEEEAVVNAANAPATQRNDDNNGIDKSPKHSKFSSFSPTVDLLPKLHTTTILLYCRSANITRKTRSPQVPSLIDSSAR